MCGRPIDTAPGPSQKSGFIFLGLAQKDSQFGLYRFADDKRFQDGDRHPAKQEKRSTNAHPGCNGYANGRPAFEWRARALEYAKLLTPERRAKLAEALCLPEASLAVLPLLGFCPDDHDGPFWTFPETDGTGRIVGINRRYRDGRKKAMKGAARGLTTPDGWANREGPIFCPEGASNTLALTALGLAAIGRPNDRAGVEDLAALLKPLPLDRPIFVVGDFDPKPDGKWPGRDGAVETAAKLAAILDRPVSWVLPPGGIKDVRKWLQSKRPDPTCADQWAELGEELRQHLEKFAKIAGKAAAAPDTFRWEPITSATFATRDYRPSWLVRRLLVRGQPGIIGGPRKSLKTSLLVDLAVSLASATPFLGEFAVYQAMRVALLSGESGGFTLQETANRICDARGVRLDDLGDKLLWQFRLPQLARLDQLADLQAGLKQDQVEVFILDPLYLALLAGQAPGSAARPENLFDMGPLLLGIAQACLAAGATPLLAHHARKNTPHEPPDLDYLAYAGVAEFARQWLLVSRREPYDPDTGRHELWLCAGGSAGHGGLWSLDIEEGIVDEHFAGRRWEVKVQTSTATRQAEKEGKQEERTQKKQEQDREDDTTLLLTLDRRDSDRQGASTVSIRREARLSENRMARAVTRLLDQGIIERVTVTIRAGNRATRTADGIRRPPLEQA